MREPTSSPLLPKIKRQRAVDEVLRALQRIHSAFHTHGARREVELWIDEQLLRIHEQAGEPVPQWRRRTDRGFRAGRDRAASPTTPGATPDLILAQPFLGRIQDKLASVISALADTSGGSTGAAGVDFGIRWQFCRRFTWPPNILAVALLRPPRHDLLPLLLKRNGRRGVFPLPLMPRMNSDHLELMAVMEELTEEKAAESLPLLRQSLWVAYQLLPRASDLYLRVFGASGREKTQVSFCNADEIPVGKCLRALQGSSASPSLLAIFSVNSLVSSATAASKTSIRSSGFMGQDAAILCQQLPTLKRPKLSKTVQVDFSANTHFGQ